jgi:hypothetical protein
VDTNILSVDVEFQQTQPNRSQEKGKKRHNPQTDVTGIAARHEECRVQYKAGKCGIDSRCQTPKKRHVSAALQLKFE